MIGLGLMVDLRESFDGLTMNGKHIGNATRQDADALAEGAFEVPEWLLQDIVPSQGMVFLSGTTGSGKTLFAQNLAWSYAAGRDEMFDLKITNPHGDYTNPQERFVLYVDGENSKNSYFRRAFGWMTHSAKMGEWEKVNERMVRWAPGEVPLSAQPGLCEMLTAQLRSEGRYPQLVVLDTLSTLSDMSDENDNALMMKLMNSIDVMCQSLQCVVLVLAHPSKKGEEEFFNKMKMGKSPHPGESIRGSSSAAQRAAAVYAMVKDEELQANEQSAALMRCVKMRDGDVRYRTLRMKIRSAPIVNGEKTIGIPHVFGITDHQARTHTAKDEALAKDAKDRLMFDEWLTIDEYCLQAADQPEVPTARTIKNTVTDPRWRDKMELLGISFEKRRSGNNRESWHIGLKE